MDHPKAVGDRSTMAIMLALTDAGYDLYVPFGENTRCDLVIDDGNGLARVQCKTGRFYHGAVWFAACSSYVHHKRPKVPARHYLDDVDFFGVYCRTTEGVYLIPIADLQVRRSGTLRVDPPRNNQRRGIRFAADYEIGRVPATSSLAATLPEAQTAAARRSAGRRRTDQASG